MKERPTPETDEAMLPDDIYQLVWADFARKLERERDEAREDATNYYAKIGELEQERDEAREKLNTNLTEISNKLVVAMRELDEVREECKEAQYESEQQSRLLGISAEREYALRGKIFELERKILQLETK